MDGVEAPHRPRDPRHRRRLRGGCLGGDELLGRVAADVGALLLLGDDVAAREPDEHKHDTAERQQAELERARHLRPLVGRPEPARTVVDEADVREEARHRHAGAEVAEARLRPLTVRKRDRKLGIAAARRERQRKAAAEAGVDVGDGQ